MQCTRGGLSTAAGEHRHSCPFEVHLRCAFQADSRELWARRCRPVMCSEAGPGRSAPASRRWCFSTVLLVLSGVRTNRWKKGFKFTSLTGLQMSALNADTQECDHFVQNSGYSRIQGTCIGCVTMRLGQYRATTKFSRFGSRIPNWVRFP
jgi:hypothetical protein